MIEAILLFVPILTTMYLVFVTFIRLADILKGSNVNRHWKLKKLLLEMSLTFFLISSGIPIPAKLLIKLVAKIFRRLTR